ncbi:MAG: hypothetical protein ACO3EE_12225 [Flavobacteriales bacterium]
MNFFKIFLFASSVLFFSCANENTPVVNKTNTPKARYINKSGPIFYNLITNLRDRGSDRTMRGFDIGDHKDSIYIGEKGERETAGTFFDSYKQTLGSNNFIYCDYRFNKQNELTFAEMNVYGINDSITKNIFDDLENRFNTMYGEKFTGLDQWSTWNSVNKKKKHFVVAIKYVPTFLSGSDDMKTALSKVMVKMEEILK